MKKILFVNSKQTQCGVYQYGLRLSNILKKSKNLEFSYIEVENHIEFLNLNLDYFEIILFNFIGGYGNGPFYWINDVFINTLKQIKPNIKLISILHDVIQNINFDFIIDQNPKSPNGIPRPLFNFELNQLFKNEKINVGSFGFQGERKGFENVVLTCNQQFDEAVINLNITNAYFGDANSILTNNQVNNIKNIPLKPNVELNITSMFLSNQEMINFLTKNDINMFLYRNSNYTASVIDYAIYANKPIAVTNEKCFEHIYDENIDIDKRSINYIIDFCINENYIQKIKDSWSEVNLLDKFEKLIYNI